MNSFSIPHISSFIPSCPQHGCCTLYLFLDVLHVTNVNNTITHVQVKKLSSYIYFTVDIFRAYFSLSSICTDSVWKNAIFEFEYSTVQCTPHHSSTFIFSSFWGYCFSPCRTQRYITYTDYTLNSLNLQWS